MYNGCVFRIPMGPKCVQRLFLHPRIELPREPRVRIQRSALHIQDS